MLRPTLFPPHPPGGEHQTSTYGNQPPQPPQIDQTAHGDGRLQTILPLDLTFTHRALRRMPVAR